MFPLRDSIPSRSFPFATLLLMVSCTIVFFWEISLPESLLLNVFHMLGIVPARIHMALAGEASFIGAGLTFFTSMFLHGGWMHLIGNMWTLWIFGDNVEDRMGKLRFMIFYFASGLAAGFTHFFFNSNSALPTVGASGAIAGVLGAYFVLFPTSRVLTLVPVFFWLTTIELPAFFYLFIWFISQLFSGTITALAPDDVGGIAWWAHAGGFAFGMLFHRFFIPKRRRIRKAIFHS